MYSPSANNIGMDLNVPTVRMVNRDAATLVVGDVVVMSTAHTGVVYPPTTRTQEPFSPLASIVKAGSAPFTPGFIGTVARLGPLDGRTNDTVDVVFGGLANAKVAAVTTDVAIGTQLSLSATTGQLTNDATGRIVAISLGAVTAGQTAKIDVILDGEIAADTAALGTFATLNVTGTATIGGNATINGLNVGTGTAAAPTSNTVLGSGAGAALQAGAIENVFVGMNSGQGTTTGDGNVSVGAFSTTVNTTSSSNTAVGTGAFFGGTGSQNVALGREALNGQTGNNATAVGFHAARINTASDITAVGANALDANTTGVRLVAVGKDALGANTASDNTAVGHAALAANQAGSGNTAVGSGALDALVTSTNDNTAVGSSALGALTDGSSNVAVGAGAAGSLNVSGTPQNGVTAVGGYALLSTTSAASTTAIGISAGRFVASGAACTSATNSVFIGANSRAADNGQDNQVVIAGSVAGVGGIGNGSNTTTIGNSSTTGTFIPAGNLTLSNGNFIVGTSGKGIDFSATANSSGTMTSELLSDYEEGTWTPTYVPQTGSYTTLTMDTLSATYTKVGRQVTVRAYIRTDVADTGGNTSALLISGLPFAGAAGVASLSAGAVFARNFAGDAPRCIMLNDANTSTLVATKTATSTSGYVVAIGSDLQNSPDSNELIFACTYFT